MAGRNLTFPSIKHVPKSLVNCFFMLKRPVKCLPIQVFVSIFNTYSLGKLQSLCSRRQAGILLFKFNSGYTYFITVTCFLRIDLSHNKTRVLVKPFLGDPIAMNVSLIAKSILNAGFHILGARNHDLTVSVTKEHFHLCW